MNTLNRFVATAGILLALVSLSFLPAAAQSYTVTDLGTLGGGTTSMAFAVNDGGQVAGVAGTPDFLGRAFLWSSSKGMMDLGLLHTSDESSIAYGINNSGQVVGQSGSSAFLWTNAAGMQDLGDLGGGGAVAYAINNSGQTVGFSIVPTGYGHAFLWSSTTGMQDLGTLGGNISQALAINDSGEVVGLSLTADNVTYHAFFWTVTDGMQDLGAGTGYATAINSAGQIAGYSLNSTNSNSAFLLDWTHGFRTLGPSFHGGSYAAGINDSIQVVGYLIDINNRARGFLWTRAAGFKSLTELITSRNPYISYASAINRVGQIAATGSNNHALLLTPIK